MKGRTAVFGGTFDPPHIGHVEICEKLKKEYTEVIIKISDIISTVTNVETAKIASENLKKIDHRLTSLTESQTMFKRKLEKLGLKYSKEAGDYIVITEDANNAQSA